MEEDNEQQDGDSLQGENGSVARYVRLTVSLLSLNLKTLLFDIQPLFSRFSYFIFHCRRNSSTNTSAPSNGSGNDTKHPSTTSKSKVSKP